MKRLILVFVGLLVMAVGVQKVKAQNTASVTDAKASATIVTPLTLSVNADGLRFGKIVKSTTADGSVTIEASSSGTRSLDVVTAIPNDVSGAAKFTVTGDDAQSFSIVKDASITLNGSGNATGKTLSVNTSMSGNASGVSTTSGSYVFYVGGKMSVPSDQTAGAYSGEFEVTVSYE